jgi:2'-hydroxyisoflavone reductase
MHVLVLGGTVFLGRHLVAAALARGHAVTLFNRGEHNPDLFPEVQKLRGNRDGALDVLDGRRWDAVIDPSGYVPRIVGASARRLAESADHYTFISSLSVYKLPYAGVLDETAPLETLPEGQEGTETITGETYGPLKVLSEHAAAEAFPGRALIIRPGLIVGPHDPTDRFTYWPARVARGGEVLAPGQPDRTVQFIDVRDLSEWIIRLVEARTAGTYNATGPEQPLSMGALLDACRSESGSDARFTWVDEALLLERKVEPYTELPLWVPAEYKDFDRFDCRKAFASGLTLRPLADTLRATLDWDATRPAGQPRRNGLGPEREAELLAAHHRKTAEPAPSAGSPESH